MSSCESFLLMMKQTPDCTLMGQRSYGSSGNSKPYPLVNGVTVWLPSWKDLRPDGTCFEGEGLKPDMLVPAREDQFRSEDPILERALQFLQRGLKLPPRKMAEYQTAGKTR
jgi:C-terminal processing protease CtpA/Prc